MIRTDDKALLFIEPQAPASEQPVFDDITLGGVLLLAMAKEGPGRYKGFHVCSCGVSSGSCDLFVPGPGYPALHNPVLVNTLLVHYLAWHRAEVPREELAKLAAIRRYNSLPYDLAVPVPQVRKYGMPAPLPLCFSPLTEGPDRNGDIWPTGARAEALKRMVETFDISQHVQPADRIGMSTKAIELPDAQP